MTSPARLAAPASTTCSLGLSLLRGHGTFVASLVTLVAPDALILPVRVLNSDGVGSDWTVASGIHYAIDHGVDELDRRVAPGMDPHPVTGFDVLDRLGGVGCAMPIDVDPFHDRLLTLP